MPRLAKTRGLTFSGLAAWVVLSGSGFSAQAPDDQVASLESAFSAPGNAPPLGLGLGHASTAEVLERIVDRSDGHVLIDPNTLHPPAVSPDSNNGFTWHESKPYTCWKVEPRERRDYAPGTAVACHVRVTLADGFVNGDGSLANGGGKPDNFFGYDCPQGFLVLDYTKDQWEAVRYFDSQPNQIGGIRVAKYNGVNYNGTTGKSVRLHAHFIEIDVMLPVDGTADNEYVKFLEDDYGPVIGSHGQILADSAGRIDYTPGLGSILYMAGPHPFDVFFTGDRRGILPVCHALK